MSEWLKIELEKRTPKIKVEELTGKAKILKIFSKVRDKQIIGARIEQGKVEEGAQIKIMRREAEIGQGKIRELQKQKVACSEVSDGEFGTLIEAKVEIAPGDFIESYVIVEK